MEILPAVPAYSLSGFVNCLGQRALSRPTLQAEIERDRESFSKKYHAGQLHRHFPAHIAV
ncbi:hypothetical protein CA13_60580 [Planctomycetes bacterium CA13]|uniref:Uncharacterized protein n=1 Tax=Novipirellula herctigrandis TaxID=2527986 RepID=A0A5C5ZBS1_9BACT|nr:hypothetical protein CA13_60580 [Planctomycetes bacterium CA13]